MTLKEACKSALTILKQVMEEKLNSTNVEVIEYHSYIYFRFEVEKSLKFLYKLFEDKHILHKHISF